jgi:hypothetical protein
VAGLELLLPPAAGPVDDSPPVPAV